jgi:hypothetical protein
MRKRCKRKVYPLLNSLAHGISGAAISDGAALDKLRLCELSAIDAMVTGKATTEDWRWIADVINIAETMARNGIGPEVLPYCQQAQESLLAAAKRYEQTKRMGLDGLGIKAVKELWGYHDLQRTSVARSVYEKMIQKTANTIRSKAKDVVEVV